VPVLFSAEQVSGTTQLEVQSGNPEARTQFAEFANRRESSTCDLGQSFIRRNQQVGVSTTIGPADAPSQLIELRQTVTVGSVDDECVGERNIQPVFDDSGRNEHVEMVMHESRHYVLEFFFTHLPMSNAHASLGTDLLHEVCKRINGFNAVVYDKYLPFPVELE